MPTVFFGEKADMDGNGLYLCYFVGFLFWSQQLPLVRCENQRTLVMLNTVSRQVIFDATIRNFERERVSLTIAVEVPLFGFNPCDEFN